MNDLLALLNQHPTLLAMWGALALHWLLPVPASFHPLHTWQQLAIQIALRVNQNTDTPRQRILSGLLAWSLMWLTVLVLLVAFYQLVWFDSLFHLVLLWLALGWKESRTFSHQFIQAYGREDKQSCRELLALALNRKTDNLSLLGLGKACAETQLLSYGRQVAGVLFWYAIAGGFGAILYRLAVSLARCWSPSRSQFQYFGLPAIRILATLDIIPLRLLAVVISLGQNSREAFRGIREQGENWQLPGPGWLLTATGHKLQLALGGPAVYDSNKMERPRLGGRIAPAALHLSQIDRLLQQRLWSWVMMQSLFMFLMGSLL
ncbi:cobalamin biosynthesis family protein [Photobacterium sp. 1_MG-2023]|uniref:cobalamin biosynthesis family protein n=1 Tax=Photobacterium sp. 1_MG-2023 TaxID=3062646 RepID=UPI0026E28C57|nr:cobalamin biosynthesis family protein [Photobacterium sp. 1_MG-2023]MDO6704825.1 cobalamin biosynthesis family protein [Photobacterium sp. 1_MG-2023]